jgi:hypothetical protein
MYLSTNLQISLLICNYFPLCSLSKLHMHLNISNAYDKHIKHIVSNFIWCIPKCPICNYTSLRDIFANASFWVKNLFGIAFIYTICFSYYIKTMKIIHRPQFEYKFHIFAGIFTRLSYTMNLKLVQFSKEKMLYYHYTKWTRGSAIVG